MSPPASAPTSASRCRKRRCPAAYLCWAVDLAFTWRYESFDSSDWAIQGVEPVTLNTVLALGADPYDYSVNFVGASVRYYFGPRKLSLPE